MGRTKAKMPRAHEGHNAALILGSWCLSEPWHFPFMSYKDQLYHLVSIHSVFCVNLNQ